MLLRWAWRWTPTCGDSQAPVFVCTSTWQCRTRSPSRTASSSLWMLFSATSRARRWTSSRWSSVCLSVLNARDSVENFSCVPRYITTRHRSVDAPYSLPWCTGRHNSKLYVWYYCVERRVRISTAVHQYAVSKFLTYWLRWPTNACSVIPYTIRDNTLTCAQEMSKWKNQLYLAYGTKNEKNKKKTKKKETRLLRRNGFVDNRVQSHWLLILIAFGFLWRSVLT